VRRLAEAIARGEVFLAELDGEPVATVTILTEVRSTGARVPRMRSTFTSSPSHVSMRAAVSARR
jgi:hypothetical protein